MPLITVFGGSYCKREELSRRLCHSFACSMLGDRELIAEGGKRFAIEENKLEAVLHGRTSVFGRFTHDKDRGIAILRSVLTHFVKRNSWVYFGFGGYLIPREVTRVLRVCAIADMDYRVHQAVKERGISERKALKLIDKEDQSLAQWISYLYQKGPWDPKFYDLVIPMDKRSVDEAATLVEERIKEDTMPAGVSLPGGIEDFALATRVELAIAPLVEIAVSQEGHGITVAVRDGHVTLTINKNVMLLSRLQKQLKRIAAEIPGVVYVEAKVGPGFYKPDIYRHCDF